MNLAPQRQYWDNTPSEKRFAHPLRLNWLASHFSIKHTILDCGCGYGRILGELVQNGYQHAVGADFSGGLLKRGRELTPDLMLVQALVERLPFEDGSFDGVLLFAVLTSMPMMDQQRALFSELHRVLRRGGLVYISDLLLNTDHRNLSRYEAFAEQFGKFGIFKLPDGGTFRHYTETCIRSLTERFDCIAYQTFTATTMNGHSSENWEEVGRATVAVLPSLMAVDLRSQERFADDTAKRIRKFYGVVIQASCGFLDPTL